MPALCRCGHGPGWHRPNGRAAAARRRKGLAPTGRRPCTFRLPHRHSTVNGRGGKRSGGICPCRDYHEEATR